MKLMGDNDNGMTGFTHIAENSKQLFCLLWGQNSCRLIQDQDIHPLYNNFTISTVCFCETDIV